ncbi:MAG: bifunctional transcriptional activator/DNA repair protein Ada [Phycisphaerales bacterium]|nr:bifunctional transcriptional activator/DNA repair protein Ada [Phycisphaerales bacterium]
MLPPKPEMQKAWLGRDETYDGVFYLAVRTTGIFCRPSCPARRPKVEHVEYFEAPKQALAAGYRPCLRCRPMENPDRPPAWVEALMRRVESESTPLRDADLRAMRIDPARARRYFKRMHGMTFHAYQRAWRLGGALHQIRQGESSDRAGLDAGFQSLSGFRDAFGRVFETTPGQSADLDPIVTRMLESPLGPLLACATGSGVCLLEFTDRRMLETQLTTLRRHFSRPVTPGSNPHLDQLADEVARYFAGELHDFAVAIEAPGTPFQERVWETLQTIPYGETWSYEKLASAVGSPGGCRAAGRANGMNRIAIVIPCHRVVNKRGSLGGYGGGLRRKQFLLELEGARGGQLW